MSAADRRLNVLQQHLTQGSCSAFADTLTLNPTSAEPSVWAHVPQASLMCHVICTLPRPRDPCGD